LPPYSPRIEAIVDLSDKACPCCKGQLHRIGEDVSERLDVNFGPFSGARQKSLSMRSYSYRILIPVDKLPAFVQIFAQLTCFRKIIVVIV